MARAALVAAINALRGSNSLGCSAKTARPERQQPFDRRDPARAVSLAHRGDAATKHHVAREQQAQLRHHHGEVFSRVRRPDMADLEPGRANIQRRHFGVQPLVSADESSIGVYPRRQLAAAGLQAQARGISGQVLAPGLVGPDGCVGGLESLHAVDVVGVVVGDDDVTDGLRGQSLDRIDQRLAERG